MPRLHGPAIMVYNTSKLHRKATRQLQLLLHVHRHPHSRLPNHLHQQHVRKRQHPGLTHVLCRNFTNRAFQLLRLRPTRRQIHLQHGLRPTLHMLRVHTPKRLTREPRTNHRTLANLAAPTRLPDKTEQTIHMSGHGTLVLHISPHGTPPRITFQFMHTRQELVDKFDHIMLPVHKHRRHQTPAGCKLRPLTPSTFKHLFPRPRQSTQWTSGTLLAMFRMYQ